MNYVLVSLGPTPNHLKFCLKQILTIDNTKNIYLITDQNILIEGVTVLNTNEFNLPDTGNYLKHNQDPLWYTSLLRIFYLNAFLQLKKEPVIHFDNDVLIFQPSFIADLYTENENYITPHKTTEYTFGFSVLKNVEKFNTLTERIYNLIQLGEQKVKEMFTETHEMRLLGHCGKDIIKDLPVHPYCARPYRDNIFDPSSYGQFVDGTPAGHSPGFTDSTQLVGSIFEKYYPKITFIDKKPHLFYADSTYKIYNLHIHTKQLQKFI